MWRQIHTLDWSVCSCQRPHSFLSGSANATHMGDLFIFVSVFAGFSLTDGIYCSVTLNEYDPCILSWHMFILPQSSDCTNTLCLSLFCRWVSLHLCCCFSVTEDGLEHLKLSANKYSDLINTTGDCHYTQRNTDRFLYDVHCEDMFASWFSPFLSLPELNPSCFRHDLSQHELETKLFTVLKCHMHWQACLITSLIDACCITHSLSFGQFLWSFKRFSSHESGGLGQDLPLHSIFLLWTTSGTFYSRNDKPTKGL